MAVADRIAVMSGGRIAQLGTPEEVYDRPCQFVRRPVRRQDQPVRGPHCGLADDAVVLDANGAQAHGTADAVGRDRACEVDAAVRPEWLSTCSRPPERGLGSRIEHRRRHGRGQPLRRQHAQHRGRDGPHRPAHGRGARRSSHGARRNPRQPRLAAGKDHTPEETAPSMANQTKTGVGAHSVASERIFIDGLMGGVLTPRVIERLAGSGLTAINLTAVRIGATMRRMPERPRRRARDHRPQQPAPAAGPTNAGDIRRAKAAGRVGIIIGMQDTEPIGRNLYVLRILQEIGVRIIQITHNRQCHVGTGCLDPDSGLSRFGRQLVAEMNRLGLVVDLSHCGPQDDPRRHPLLRCARSCARTRTRSRSVPRRATRATRSSPSWPPAAASSAWRPGLPSCTAAPASGRSCRTSPTASTTSSASSARIMWASAPTCATISRPRPSRWEPSYGPRRLLPGGDRRARGLVSVRRQHGRRARYDRANAEYSSTPWRAAMSLPWPTRSSD